MYLPWRRRVYLLQYRAPTASGRRVTRLSAPQITCCGDGSNVLPHFLQCLPAWQQAAGSLALKEIFHVLTLNPTFLRGWET